eukprot:gene17582-20978_t
MKNFENPVLEYIHKHNLAGIRAGKDRTTFLNIWMVTLQNRIFARSWGLAEKSWYHSLKEGEQGAIQYGTNVVLVKGIIPHDLDAITPLINAAYLLKYDTGGDNSYYAHGITEPQHIKHTMEFIPLL